MLHSYQFEDQLNFLEELARQWKGNPPVLRMILSLTDSVKAARDHQDCLKAISLNRREQ
jgi:hypothetical protein